MKKGRLFLNMVICILLLICCVGCKSGDVDEQSDMNVYYVSEDSVKLVTQPYNTQNTEKEKLVNELLDRLTTAGEGTNKSAIPKEVAVLGYSVVDRIAKIDFDEKYYEMNSKRELLCRAAVVLTLMQIDGLEYVTFTINGHPCVEKTENISMQ